MCVREMTLGEEIINLTNKGVDISTVERMHRKYIEMIADKESKEAMEAYCIDDAFSIKEFVNAILGAPAKSNLKDAKVGDNITIKLDKLGKFTATVHKVTDDKIMLIFDDYVTKKPMNEIDTNTGGFEESDLNKWLQTEFVRMLPYSIGVKLVDVTIPSVGEMFGWDDEWNKNHFEKDNDEQLPLMKQRRNRVAYFNNESEYGWLKNATKKDFSAASFAIVGDIGSTYCNDASVSYAVRPVLWLVK